MLPLEIWHIQGIYPITQALSLGEDSSVSFRHRHHFKQPETMNSSLFTLVSQPFFTQQKSSLLAAPGHLDWQSERAVGIRGIPLRSWKRCSLASFLLSASPAAKQSLSPRLSGTAEYPERTFYEESLLCSINGEEINIFEGN